MRRSELLQLHWLDIDLEAQLATLHETKNGHARTIPLTRDAIKVLATLSRQVPLSEAAIDQLTTAPRDTGRPFPVTEVAMRQAWDRLRVRAGIDDLTFHDLRHEAISRMFDDGMKIHEVMAISGHRTASQLFRYVQTLKA